MPTNKLKTQRANRNSQSTLLVTLKRPHNTTKISQKRHQSTERRNVSGIIKAPIIFCMMNRMGYQGERRFSQFKTTMN